MSFPCPSIDFDVEEGEREQFCARPSPYLRMKIICLACNSTFKFCVQRGVILEILWWMELPSRMQILAVSRLITRSFVFYHTFHT